MFLTFNRKANTTAIKALLSRTLLREPNVVLMGQYVTGYYERPHWLTHTAYVEYLMKQIALLLTTTARVFVYTSEEIQNTRIAVVVTPHFRYLVDVPPNDPVEIATLHERALREKTRIACLLPPFSLVVVLTPVEWYIHSTTPLLMVNREATIFSTELCAPLGCVFGVSHTTAPTVTSREWRQK